MATPLALVVALPTTDPLTENATVAPDIAPPSVFVSVAVKLTGPVARKPSDAGLGGCNARLVASGAAKRAVRVRSFLFSEKLQGFVEPEQVVPARLVGSIVQPTNAVPAFGVTVRTPVSSLLSARKQFDVHATTSLEWLKAENDTLPPPLPAKLMVRFLLSVNVICARDRVSVTRR